MEGSSGSVNPASHLPDDPLLDYHNVLQDLKELYVELSFLQQQELELKRELWARDPESSIQARDRAASYGVVHITTQIMAVDAQIRCFNLDRTYLERILNLERPDASV